MLNIITEFKHKNDALKRAYGLDDIQFDSFVKKFFYNIQSAIQKSNKDIPLDKIEIETVEQTFISLLNTQLPFNGEHFYYLVFREGTKKENNKYVRTGTFKLTLELGYKADLFFLTKHDPKATFKCGLVYEGDRFEPKCFNNTASYIHEMKNHTNDFSQLICSYFFVQFSDGSSDIEIISKQELELIRKKSTSFVAAEKNTDWQGNKINPLKDSVWHLWANEMSKKTSILRLLKTKNIKGYDVLLDIEAQNYNFDAPKTSEPKVNALPQVNFGNLEAFGHTVEPRSEVKETAQPELQL
jgi:recombinational DNA repair protein RecT